MTQIADKFRGTGIVSITYTYEGNVPYSYRIFNSDSEVAADDRNRKLSKSRTDIALCTYGDVDLDLTRPLIEEAIESLKRGQVVNLSAILAK